jgi:hypothetical protein
MSYELVSPTPQPACASLGSLKYVFRDGTTNSMCFASLIHCLVLQTILYKYECLDTHQERCACCEETTYNFILKFYKS